MLGAALLALGVACWIARDDIRSRTAAGLVGAMLLYNVAVVLLLGYASVALRLSGFGSWPAIALHSVLVAWCIACLRLSRPNLTLLVAAFLMTGSMVRGDEPLRLSLDAYTDRAHATWVAQMAAVYLGFPFEHRTRSVRWLNDYPRPYTHSIVDDDWYYEMSALRAFEKHGPGLTVQQLGEQWLADRCGAWGSSREARLNMERGIHPPDCGHPRFNHSWWTIGPQFSSEIYGLLAPGRPDLAARLARELGHINGYAEAVDGATFIAGMVSLAFVENNPQAIVHHAATLVHPESPYRQCLDQIIALADRGKSFVEIEHEVVERWTAEYPGTNNAVANGGIVALCVWFGEGDFLKTVNLACRATDYADADCNAANAAAVIGAMQGLQAIPKHLLDPLHDRILGDKLGDVVLPHVDETISALGRRTAAIGQKFLLQHGARVEGDTLIIDRVPLQPLPLERFTLGDLTRYWAPEWQLEHAGFGATIGGRGGYPGGTWLDGDVLTTLPRNLMRGTVLSRKVVLPMGNPRLSLEVSADARRGWELSIYADNTELSRQIIVGSEQPEWKTLEIDLHLFAGKEVTLRLYQNVIMSDRPVPPSPAHWKRITLR